MKDHDPRPLVDAGSGAPELLRDALSAARARAPGAAQLESLAARLPLSAAGAVAPIATTPAAATPPSMLSGALIGAALGVLVSGTALLWPTAPARQSAPVTPPAAVMAPLETPKIEAFSVRGAAPRAVAEIASAPATASAAPRPAPPSVPAAIEPSAVDPVEVAPTAGSLGAATSLAESETEAHLLERAQAALRASPAQALAITQEHAARFPGGSLGQERELLAIQALVRLGRADEARARADRFMAAYPGSAHRNRIESLLRP